MPANFQFGFEHHLYIAATDDPATVGDATDYTIPQALNGVLTGTVNVNNAAWHEYANVRTVNVGGNATSVDITTREEARSGFSSEVDVTTSGEMTFEVRYKPTDSNGVYQDVLFAALMKTWLGKKEIAAVDLDKLYTVKGAQGLAGNWTVNFSAQKEVQGVVLCNLTLKLSSFPGWIVQTHASSGQVFVVFS
jgi:hypothetical protein